MTKSEYFVAFIIVIFALSIIIRATVNPDSYKYQFMREETYKVVDKIKKDKSGEYTIKCEDINGDIINLKLANVSENRQIDIDQFYKVILVGKIYDFQIINHQRKYGMDNKLYIIGYGEVEEF